MKNASVYKAIFSNIAGCVFFITIFIPATAQAQTRGTVEVIKDARIDTLAAHRASLKATGTITVAAATTGYGYRVQIYNGSSRKEAYDVQSRFMNEYPGMRTYIGYTEPNYKVRAGDFRSRLEAERLMQELRGKFTSLFIIGGRINPPKPGTGND
ncbi:SPOR domain-containing protein [Mucilaginibacter sp. UYCu711]|uniref:SPOR domain-containing protein n=1 Tax=Mucilaginibacter sp. UYCu711 TaxID=3156339 RepID=UPI003D1B571D